MRVNLFALGSLSLLACWHTSRDTQTVNGQTITFDHSEPSVGESVLQSVVRGCLGPVHDDDGALSAAPLVDNCKREDMHVEYVVDGIHKVDVCGLRVRVTCHKTSTKSGYLDADGCGVSCIRDPY